MSFPQPDPADSPLTHPETMERHRATLKVAEDACKADPDNPGRYEIVVTCIGPQLLDHHPLAKITACEYAERRLGVQKAGIWLSGGNAAPFRGVYARRFLVQ